MFKKSPSEQLTFLIELLQKSLNITEDDANAKKSEEFLSLLLR